MQCVSTQSIPFERYADDIIVHCRSEKQAKWIRAKIESRLLQWKLELNPGGTKIVYCKDSNRVGKYRREEFDFLGYTFRPRLSRSRYGHCFVNFSPAVSNKAVKKMRDVMRSWRLHFGSNRTFEDIAAFCNPVIRGWINYYGRYHKTALQHTVRWAMKKYKRLRRRLIKALQWLGRICRTRPYLMAHWQARFRLWVGQ